MSSLKQRERARHEWVIDRHHRDAVPVDAMQIGPCHDLRRVRRVGLGHTPALEDRLELLTVGLMLLTVLTTGLSGIGKGSGVMFELETASRTADLLRAGGWTTLTALNLMLFSLVHNPCSTTIYTIWKETRSLKWTTLSTLLPIAVGMTLCFFVAQVWRLVVT